MGIFCNQTCNVSKHDCNAVVDTTCDSCRSEDSVKNRKTCGIDPRRSDTCMEGCRGDECDQQCQHRCVVCDRYRDECIRCVTGWYGITCEAHCPSSCKGHGCDMKGLCNDDNGVTSISTGSDEEIAAVTWAYAETTRWKPVLIVAICVLAVFALVVILTVKLCVFTSKRAWCCFNLTEPLDGNEADRQRLDGRGFILDFWREGSNNRRDGERERFFEDHLHPVEEENQDVRMDNIHYHPGHLLHPHPHHHPHQHAHQHPGRYGYETLDFIHNADADHVYDDLSRVQTSRL